MLIRSSGDLLDMMRLGWLLGRGCFSMPIFAGPSRLVHVIYRNRRRCRLRCLALHGYLHAGAPYVAGYIWCRAHLTCTIASRSYHTIRVHVYVSTYAINGIRRYKFRFFIRILHLSFTDIHAYIRLSSPLLCKIQSKS